MAYTPREIKDRVATGDDIFIVEDLGDNRVRLIPAPTHVLEVGTPVNKALLQPIEDYLATGVVPVERSIMAGSGLTGGGSLNTNRTISVDFGKVVPVERTITAGTGLIGGGSLDADRTLSVKFGTTAGTVCEGNDSRFARTPYTLLDHFINSGEIETAQIAGIKNSIFRGKNLGTSYTSGQRSQVASGKFLDLWVGDYWVINGTRYYIAAFNYYYNTGDTCLTTNHITLVPAGSMYTRRMNPTDTTEGGYVDSEMYTTGLDQAKTRIYADFAGHVLTHRRYLSIYRTSFQVLDGKWCDSDVELMNEVMAFGSVVNGEGGEYNIGAEKSQLPLFALRPDLLNISIDWWLRDVCASARFAYVASSGSARSALGIASAGVRPVFSIS